MLPKKHHNKILAPSLLSADFSKLSEEIQEIEKAGADWLHLDIMDGHFVPNLSLGPALVKSLRKISQLPFDCHLMVMHPEQWIEAFAKAGANSISIHAETHKDFHDLFKKIRSFNCQVGLSIKPKTAVSTIKDLIPAVDLVLVMSVEPGFGGQKFMEISYSKIQDLVQMRKQMQKDFLIQVDGGIGPDNINALVKAGADVFVVGSAIFLAKERKKAIEDLRREIQA